MSVADPIPAPTPREPLNPLRRLAANAVAWWRGLAQRPRRALPPVPAGRWLLLAALAVGLVAVVMALGDAAVIQWQRGLPPAVVGPFDVLTDLGRSNWVLVPTGGGLLLLAALASPQAGLIAYRVLTALAVRLGFVFVAVGLPGLAVTVVKRLIGRARPYEELGGPFDFRPGSWDPQFASLPSGHGTTVCAAAVALGALYPRLRLPLWGLAGVIAASRTVVAAHYPSDILAAAVVGIGGALMVRRWFAARRLAFAVTPAGAIVAMPGPSWRRIGRAIRRTFAR